MQRRLENLNSKCDVMYCPRIAFRVLHEQRPCFDPVSCFLQSFYDVYGCLTSTQKQNRTLIMDPKLLSFNSIQSRDVTGHLTGHHFLGRFQYNSADDSSLYRRCGAEEETSAHVLSECEALATLRHTYPVSFFWTQRMSEI
jgi:hypothetical protein